MKLSKHSLQLSYRVSLDLSPAGVAREHADGRVVEGDLIQVLGPEVSIC